MKKTLQTIVITIILLAPLTQAQASTCYTPLQAEADQAIRIHSELMVIGLNCQHMGQRAGQNLYGTYRQMTADHANLYAKYEDILMQFFASQPGETNPEAQINALRTKYANKISKDVASMRPDVFCSRYAPRVTKAAALSETALRKWASTFHANHPVSHPICPAQTQQASY